MRRQNEITLRQEPAKYRLRIGFNNHSPDLVLVRSVGEMTFALQLTTFDRRLVVESKFGRVLFSCSQSLTQIFVIAKALTKPQKPGIWTPGDTCQRRKNEVAEDAIFSSLGCSNHNCVSRARRCQSRSPTDSVIPSPH